MTVFARRLGTILVWASQEVVNGPTKCRVLARGANSPGLIKYCINTRFRSKHDVNVNHYCDNIVPITACLLGRPPSLCKYLGQSVKSSTISFISGKLQFSLAEHIFIWHVIGLNIPMSASRSLLLLLKPTALALEGKTKLFMNNYCLRNPQAPATQKPEKQTQGSNQLLTAPLNLSSVSVSNTVSGRSFHKRFRAGRKHLTNLDVLHLDTSNSNG